MCRTTGNRTASASTAHSGFKYKNDYAKSRYRFLNLHSFFVNGHYEIRGCNGTLDRDEIHAYLSMFLGVHNAAMTKQRCSPVESTTTNMKYAVRVVLINLGLNGKEFATARKVLLAGLDGNSAWLHPEDGVKQRERLKALRIALREQAQAPQTSSEADFEEEYKDKDKAEQSDSDGNYEYMKMDDDDEDFDEDESEFFGMAM